VLIRSNRPNSIVTAGPSASSTLRAFGLFSFEPGNNAPSNSYACGTDSIYPCHEAVSGWASVINAGIDR
jgi:hypothetical protein